MRNASRPAHAPPRDQSTPETPRSNTLATMPARNRTTQVQFGMRRKRRSVTTIGIEIASIKPRRAWEMGDISRCAVNSGTHRSADYEENFRQPVRSAASEQESHGIPIHLTPLRILPEHLGQRPVGGYESELRTLPVENREAPGAAFHQ